MSQAYKLPTIQALLLRSWQELKSRFRPFILLALIGPVVSWFLQGIAMGFDPLRNQETSASLLLVVPCALLTFFISMWCLVAFVMFVCKRASDWKELFWLALLKLPRFVAGIIVYGLFIIAYTVICILLWVLIAWILQKLPALGILMLFLMILAFAAGIIYVSVHFILLPYVLILTDISLFDTFTAAYRLIKNRWWHTFGLLVVLSLIGMMVFLAFGIVIGILAIASYVIWPATRYFFSFLFVIPGALMILIQQIPLIALYIDSAYSLQKSQQQSAPLNN